MSICADPYRCIYYSCPWWLLALILRATKKVSTFARLQSSLTEGLRFLYHYHIFPTSPHHTTASPESADSGRSTILLNRMRTQVDGAATSDWKVCTSHIHHNPRCFFLYFPRKQQASHLHIDALFYSSNLPIC